MIISKLKFISRVLENYRTGYCDEQQNCSCESCTDNFTIEMAQRYLENEYVKNEVELSKLDKINL